FSFTSLVSISPGFSSFVELRSELICLCNKALAAVDRDSSVLIEVGLALFLFDLLFHCPCWGIRLLQIDRYLIDVSGELVIALRVIWRHGSVKVHAHVRRLNSEKERNGALDSAGGDLLSIDEN